MTAFEILGSAKADDSLISLLEQAIRGDSPGGAGGLEMPQWAERRESRRVQVCCPAAIIRAGRRQSGILRNISTTGIGLETAGGLEIGENIVVRTGQSCSLEGTVVWSSGAEAGIKLRRTIQSDDPRLKFCSDD
jgi:hypothetical protein